MRSAPVAPPETPGPAVLLTGDFPDPTVVRGGDTYYITHSSFDQRCDDVAVAVGVAHYEIFGLTFQSIMPVSFVTGAIVGSLASLAPIGHSLGPASG